MTERYAPNDQTILIDGPHVNLDLGSPDNLADGVYTSEVITLFDYTDSDSLPVPIDSARLSVEWKQDSDTFVVDGRIDISPMLPKESGTSWPETIRDSLRTQLGDNKKPTFSFHHDPHATFIQLDDTYLASVAPHASLGTCDVELSTVKIADIIDQDWCDVTFDEIDETLSSKEMMIELARLFGVTLNTIAQKYGISSIDNPPEPKTLRVAAKEQKPPSKNNALELAGAKAVTLAEMTSTSTDKQPENKPASNTELGGWPRVSFHELGGLSHQIAALRNMANRVIYRDRALQHGVQPDHLLLYGPDGTGKQSLLRAFANEMDAKLHILRATAVSQAFMDTVLKETDSPQVIIIEDIDTLGASTAYGNYPVLRHVLRHGMELARVSYPNVIFTATTNQPLDEVDPVLIAPDRFVTMQVDKPNHAELQDIWVTFLAQHGPIDSEIASVNKKFILPKQFKPEYDYGALASLSADMTGLDIKTVVQAARVECFNFDIANGVQQAITQEQLLRLISSRRKS